MPATRTMKHGERDPRSTTGEILSQLRPRSLARDGRDLVVKFQNDDAFRSYVAYRAWALIAVVLVFVLVSTVLSVTVMFDVVRWVPAPTPFWLRALALLLSAVVWVGGIVAQVYLFVLSLEAKAARLDRTSRGMVVAVPKGFLPYLKYSRTLAPWILAVACVALPLALLAASAPVAALVLALLTVLAPLLFSRLDP
jgi:hypothetical protein